MLACDACQNIGKKYIHPCHKSHEEAKPSPPSAQKATLHREETGHYIRFRASQTTDDRRQHWQDVTAVPHPTSEERGLVFHSLERKKDAWCAVSVLFRNDVLCLLVRFLWRECFICNLPQASITNQGAEHHHRQPRVARSPCRCRYVKSSGHTTCGFVEQQQPKQLRGSKI